MYHEVLQPRWSKVVSIGLPGHWCVGLLLGLVSGALPLVAVQLRDPTVDPFDYGISYIVWVGSSFGGAFVLTYMRPHRQVVSALSILSGFLAAMILEIVIDYYTARAPHNLWPLTLIFAVLIGAPPVFAGAYVGSRQRR